MPKNLTASDRSALIRRASTMPKGAPERRAILAGLKSGAKYDRPKRLLLISSTISELKKAESMYEFDGSNDSEVLHHLGQAMTNIAWNVRELDDPQAEKLMDVTRSFESKHR